MAQRWLCSFRTGAFRPTFPRRAGTGLSCGTCWLISNTLQQTIAPTQDVPADVMLQHPRLYAETMGVTRGYFLLGTLRWLLEALWHSAVREIRPSKRVPSEIVAAYLLLVRSISS